MSAKATSELCCILARDNDLESLPRLLLEQGHSDGDSEYSVDHIRTLLWQSGIIMGDKVMSDNTRRAVYDILSGMSDEEIESADECAIRDIIEQLRAKGLKRSDGNIWDNETDAFVGEIQVYVQQWQARKADFGKRKAFKDEEEGSAYEDDGEDGEDAEDAEYGEYEEDGEDDVDDQAEEPTVPKEEFILSMGRDEKCTLVGITDELIRHGYFRTAKERFKESDKQDKTRMDKIRGILLEAGLVVGYDVSLSQLDGWKSTLEKIRSLRSESPEEICKKLIADKHVSTSGDKWKKNVMCRTEVECILKNDERTEQENKQVNKQDDANNDANKQDEDKLDVRDASIPERNKRLRDLGDDYKRLKKFCADLGVTASPALAGMFQGHAAAVEGYLTASSLKIMSDEVAIALGSGK